MKCAAEVEKIARERRIIEAARQRSTYFPSGELVRNEPPGWLIPSASLGIELTDLLPAKPGGALFSGPQLSSCKEAVVTTAEHCSCSSANAPPADVLVYFRNDWNRKSDVKEIAQALASFVLSNYPSGAKDTVTLEPMSCGALNGVSVVRIFRGESAWHTGGCAGIECVTYEQVAERIAAKDLLLPEYRRRWPGWQMWLLLSTRMRVLHSVYIPREVTSWQFNTGFDKVLLSSWEDGVLELHRTSSRTE